MSLDQKTIAEVRRMVQLENVRSAVFSLAAETLDENVVGLRVSCDLDSDGSFGLDIALYGAKGVEVGGISL